MTKPVGRKDFRHTGFVIDISHGNNNLRVICFQNAIQMTYPERLKGKKPWLVCVFTGKGKEKGDNYPPHLLNDVNKIHIGKN